MIVRVHLPNGNYLHVFLLNDNDQDEKPEQEEEKEDHKTPKVEDKFENDEEELRMQEAFFNSILSTKSTPTVLAEEEEKVFDYKKKGIVTSFPVKTCFQYYGASPTTREIGECSHSFCVICEDVKSSASMIRNKCCNHYVCEDCMVIYVGEKLQENIREIKCPESKCKAVLDSKNFENLIPGEVFDQWRNALCEARALESPRFIKCPFRDCGALIRDDRRGHLTRACTNCWKIFCFRCMDSWHFGMSCHMFQVRQARRRQLMRRRYIDDDDQGAFF